MRDAPAGLGLTELFSLEPELALGVILVGCAPGGTASNVITYLARGDVALSVSMTVVSTLLAPVLTPLLVYLLAGSRVDVSFPAMMASVLNMVLVPVLAGLLLRKAAWGLVRRCVDFCPLVSVIGIVLIVGGIVAVNADKIAESGLLVLLLVFLHNGAGVLLGLGIAALFGMNYAGRTAVAVEVGMQNSGLAVALAAALDPALIRAQTDCDCYCCRFEPPAYGQVILHETGKWYEGLGQITRRNASVLRAVDADRFKSMVVRALVLSL